MAVCICRQNSRVSLNVDDGGDKSPYTYAPRIRILQTCGTRVLMRLKLCLYTYMCVYTYRKGESNRDRERERVRGRTK